jgi:hypothetical protein
VSSNRVNALGDEIRVGDTFGAVGFRITGVSPVATTFRCLVEKWLRSCPSPRQAKNTVGMHHSQFLSVSLPASGKLELLGEWIS